MTYSLGQAAKATGLSKTTIAKAISKGRISAARGDLGEYVIDPAELHRVYPLQVQITPKVDDTRPQVGTELLIENACLKARLDSMSELKSQIEAERDNLREQNTRITALLAAPKPESKPDDRYAVLLEKMEKLEREFSSQQAEDEAPVVTPPAKTEALPNRGLFAWLKSRAA
jgi:hypothetical protein